MKTEDMKVDLYLARDAIDQALELLDNPRPKLTTWHVFLARQIIQAKDALERIVQETK